MTSQWTIERLHKALGAHAANWDALNRRLFDSHPMLDSRFIDGMLRHFGTGKESLCTLSVDGQPQAMCVLRPRGPVVWTSFLPAQAQIGPTLIPEPAMAAELLRTLPPRSLALDFLCNDPKFGHLCPDEARGVHPVRHALTMGIKLSGTFDDYWGARPRQLQKNMNRYARRLEAAGLESRYLAIADAAGIAAAVKRYGDLEAKGWKGKIGTAVTNQNVQGVFYSQVMAQFAQTGEATVYELWIGDKLAASRMVIRAGAMAVILKTTFEEEFDVYAPGRLLLKHVIRHAFETCPGAVLEFYTDANPDQLSWATEERWITHASYYRHALAQKSIEMVRMGQQILKSDRKLPGEVEALVSISTYAHPDEFPADVRQLFAVAEKDSVELGASWYGNLINTVFRRGGEVVFYVLRRRGHPVAALPVLTHKTLLGHHVDALGNFYTSIYSPQMEKGVKARDLVPLIRFIRNAHAPLASMTFAPMAPESPGFQVLLEALRAAGMPSFQFYCFGNWFLQVEGDWAAYLKGRSGTLRSTIKRMTRKFTDDGGTTELLLNEADIERGMAAYNRTYAASWKKPEPFQDFVPGLARTCGQRGWLRLGLAWLNGEPVAAQLWIVANGKADIYKVAYDEKYKAYAPGTLLTAMLLEHVIEKDHVTEVDFLIGDDPYKKTWMSHRRERWGIVAYNPKSVGGVVGVSREIAGKAFKWLAARAAPLLTKLKSKKKDKAKTPPAKS
jgi:CelD/BcsL family acetyltransferase involved in cellulose biosynthesis